MAFWRLVVFGLFLGLSGCLGFLAFGVLGFGIQGLWVCPTVLGKHLTSKEWLALQDLMEGEGGYGRMN